MHVSRAAGLLVLGVALAGCGVAQNATVDVGQVGGAAAAPNAVVVSGSAPGPALTPLQRRTAGSVTLRTFTTPSLDSVGCGGSGECVPDWCQPTQTVVVELSTPAMAAVLDGEVIGLGSGSALSVLGTYSGAPDAGVGDAVPTGGTAYSSSLGVSSASGPVPITVLGPGQPAVVGTAEGDPVQVLAVRVAPTVATVTMRTAHGEDTTVPVRGLAVLAAPGSAASGEVTASDARGHTVATVSLPTPPTQSTAACAPEPPSLPPAGVQPTDPATATAAIRQAYTTAFTSVPGQNADRVPPGIQDGQQILSAINQARQNFPQAAASITVKTGQLVFTSPTTAALFFTVTYQQGVPYGTKIGQAVLEDGSWLVTKDTYCGLLAFAGATCPAG